MAICGTGQAGGAVYTCLIGSGNTRMEGEQMRHLEFFGFSEKGMRERNEDAFLAADLGEMYVFAVAEGMGGPKEGPTAARIAVDALGAGGAAREKTLAGTLEQLLGRAERALYNLEAENPGIEPSGVALGVAILSPGGECVVSSPGSRKVFFLAEEEKGTAPDAASAGHGQLTLHDPGPGMHEATLPPGYLVLCSDGISDFIPDSRIVEIVAERGDDLEDACRKLVYEAFQNGSDDNLTVVLVRRRASS